MKIRISACPIGQNNVGQNFRQLRKISSLLSDAKFCPFSKFEINSEKTQIIYFFRDLPFLYQKNNSNNKKVLLFNNFAQLDLAALNQGWLSFHFWPDHFTMVFLNLLTLRILNLQCLSLSLCFNRLNIVIHPYYDFDFFFVLNFCFIVLLSLKV